ncbi:hypothetical protein [Pseudorhodoferax aquiterrae]|uniref:hypothetical protein n=1 Tax=Pseudorhodoferax aquiterrae TaxID=747304 RepID=UPI00167990DE|nr:hypothetical protein [Pseudorhodoferax aquiterrae]
MSGRAIAVFVAVAMTTIGGAVSAQTTPVDAAALKQQKEDAETRRDTYKAQLEAEVARRALEAALDPAKQGEAAQAAAIKVAKDTADAQAALANAQKAQSEAELAALKKRYGDFSGSGISGTAELTGSAGTAEATLLGSVAVNRIAKEFAAPLKALSATGSIVLTTATTVPDFQALTAFETQFLAVSTAVAAARLGTSDKAADNAGLKTESVAGIGLGLDAVSKILSFAKTDYKFVNLDVAGTDAMLLRALAGLLKDKTVEIPAFYVADAISASNRILSRTGDINKWSVEAKGRVKFHEAAQAEFEKQIAAKPADQDLKDGLQKAKSALSTWKAVSESVDAWSKQLTTADDKGNSPIATIARQSAIKNKLENNGVLVIVELHKVAGSGYTKKNLWSSLGANPFFVMGGAVASYVALEGNTGRVLDAQMLPVHGGYHSVSDIKGVVNEGLAK